MICAKSELCPIAGFLSASLGGGVTDSDVRAGKFMT
jgi:hypothetical protein